MHCVAGGQLIYKEFLRGSVAGHLKFLGSGKNEN
jgi:hypothetical protein